MSDKNRKSILKLYNTLSASLKYDKIENLSICIIYSFKIEFKIFEEVVFPNIFLRFFISNHITNVKLFPVSLSY
jgi:hypothetical protein